MDWMEELAASFAKIHCLLVVVWAQHSFQAPFEFAVLKQSMLFALMNASIRFQIGDMVVYQVLEFLISIKLRSLRVKLRSLKQKIDQLT